MSSYLDSKSIISYEVILGENIKKNISVRWKGKYALDDTWMIKEELQKLAPDLLDDYMNIHRKVICSSGVDTIHAFKQTQSSIKAQVTIGDHNSNSVITEMKWTHFQAFYKIYI